MTTKKLKNIILKGNDVFITEVPLKVLLKFVPINDRQR